MAAGLDLRHRGGTVMLGSGVRVGLMGGDGYHEFDDNTARGMLEGTSVS